MWRAVFYLWKSITISVYTLPISEFVYTFACHKSDNRNCLINSGIYEVHRFFSETLWCLTRAINKIPVVLWINIVILGLVINRSRREGERERPLKSEKLYLPEQVSDPQVLYIITSRPTLNYVGYAFVRVFQQPEL